MLAVIPFSGFYNSLHDAELDHACEMMLSDDRGDQVHDKLPMRLFDAVNWRAAHESYARQYALEWCDRFGIDGAEFDELNSPREYNFRTDRIFIRLPEPEVARIHAAIERPILDEVTREMFTSRSGFISHYPPSVEDWGDVSEWDHNQIFALLTAWQRQHEPDFEEWSLIEDWAGNGKVDDWILNTPAAVRVANLAYRIRRMRGVQ